MEEKAGANNNRRAVLPKQDRKILKEEILSTYVEKSLGICVELREAARKVTYDDGTVATEIPDIEGLVATVAMARALMPIRFSASELKFLRKAIGYTGRELAEALETSIETVSRWENGQQMGGYVEKNYRLLICSLLREAAPAVPYDPDMIAFMKVKVPTGSSAPIPPIVVQRVRLHKIKSSTLESAWGTTQLAA